MHLLWIVALGSAGVLLRYGIDSWAARWGAPPPVATGSINVLGSFLAGLLYVAAENGRVPPGLRAGLQIGLLGGFTTFSAYAVQSAVLLRSPSSWAGIAYALGSPALGLAAAAVGIGLARSFA